MVCRRPLEGGKLQQIFTRFSDHFHISIHFAEFTSRYRERMPDQGWWRVKEGGVGGGGKWDALLCLKDTVIEDDPKEFSDFPVGNFRDDMQLMSLAPHWRNPFFLLPYVGSRIGSCICNLGSWLLALGNSWPRLTSGLNESRPNTQFGPKSRVTVEAVFRFVWLSEPFQRVQLPVEWTLYVYDWNRIFLGRIRISNKV